MATVLDYMQEEKHLNPRTQVRSSHTMHPYVQLGDREVDTSDFSHSKRSRQFTGDELLAKRLRSAPGGGVVHPKPRGLDGDDQDASHGAIGNNYSSAKQEGPIIADHRTDPAPYQSAVVNMALVLRPDDIFKQRKLNWDCAKDKTNDLIAPLGTLDCFVVRVGEMVFSEKGYQAETYRNADTHGAFVPVFSCVNGMYKHQDIVFQGAHIFSQDGAPKTAYNSDAVGTVQTRGTITVVNTGPNVIQVGEQVYASIFPWTRLDDNGNIQPKIVIPGTAGAQGEKDLNTGVSEARFLPATYALSQWDMAAYFKGVDIDIENIWETSGLLDSVQSNKTALEAMEGMQYKCNHALFAESAVDLPARNYANAMIANYLWKVYSLEEPRLAMEIGLAVLEWTKRLHQKSRDDSEQYQANLGANSVPFTHPSLNPVVGAKLAELGTWTSESRSIDRLRPQAALGKWTENLCKDATFKQQAFLDAHVAGKSMHAVEPGGSFEVDIGSR
jgi:hypothetical protein